MEITKKTLRAAGAERRCAGLEYFNKMYPQGYITSEWAKEDQRAIILSPLREWWGWAVRQGVIPAWSMYRWYFKGANLMRADLRGANLRAANLDGALLTAADLRNADLECAALECADLRAADLECANLRAADLRGANLRGANLRTADLRCADPDGSPNE